ncbi:YihY/virulence factor BrkB family protein [Sediminibacillus albus]|uniref:Membrane protein n=1 Tax=Sediminibacillus albus TaxID=407036 RepID=A0A1G8XH68_9BACI|nr:YihY/virulence factor BrkB family protein [Sediminibacillus albus]SDJ89325.1 membrane protein [Sediminibacillus albus]
MSKMIAYGKELGKEFKKDDATTLAAAQAFYYLLAIVPLLILLLSILPYLSIDPQRAVNFVGNILPSEIAGTFEDTVVNVVSNQRGGLLTIGILGTLWSASKAVNAFIDASNHAYNVEESRSFIKVRLLSLALTLGMVLALAVALVFPIFGGVLLDFIKSFIHLPNGTEILLNVLRWVVSIFVMIVILTALYWSAPNIDFPFKQVIPGAIGAAILWQIISLGFSFYLSNFGNYSATYGSLGGVVILLLWFFLTGLTLVIGAEINAIYHRRKNAS